MDSWLACRVDGVLAGYSGRVDPIRSTARSDVVWRCSKFLRSANPPRVTRRVHVDDRMRAGTSDRASPHAVDAACRSLAIK